MHQCVSIDTLVHSLVRLNRETESLMHGVLMEVCKSRHNAILVFKEIGIPCAYCKCALLYHIKHWDTSSSTLWITEPHPRGTVAWYLLLWACWNGDLQQTHTCIKRASYCESTEVSARVLRLYLWCNLGSALIGSEAAAWWAEGKPQPDVESSWGAVESKEASLWTSGTEKPGFLFSTCTAHHCKYVPLLGDLPNHCLQSSLQLLWQLLFWCFYFVYNWNVKYNCKDAKHVAWNENKKILHWRQRHVLWDTNRDQKKKKHSFKSAVWIFHGYDFANNITSSRR